MLSTVHVAWTGITRLCRHSHKCVRAPVVNLSSCRRQHFTQHAHLHHMEVARNAKRQCIDLEAFDTQADSIVDFPTESVEKTAQQPFSSVKSHDADLADRKRKLLPVPQLIKPGMGSHTLDIWDCAALLVDKPQTWTSFDVCGKLKGLLKVKKIGHAGTLDPMATGLLIICTGKATKSIDSFQAMHKEYSGTMKLGEATASYDADGAVTETLPWDHLTLHQLQEEARSRFTGALQQIPPMYSALRVKGKRLYESAREGKVVERAARPVHVYRFDLSPDAEDPQKVHFYIACSKGTYIRSLAHDLGQAVGTAAHLVALRREAIGEYNVKNAWTVDQLQAAFGAPKHAKGMQPKSAAPVPITAITSGSEEQQAP